MQVINCNLKRVVNWFYSKQKWKQEPVTTWCWIHIPLQEFLQSVWLNLLVHEVLQPEEHKMNK